MKKPRSSSSSYFSPIHPRGNNISNGAESPFYGGASGVEGLAIAAGHMKKTTDFSSTPPMIGSTPTIKDTEKDLQSDLSAR